jgi:hypothetical protein
MPSYVFPPRVRALLRFETSLLDSDNIRWLAFYKLRNNTLCHRAMDDDVVDDTVSILAPCCGEVIGYDPTHLQVLERRLGHLPRSTVRCPECDAECSTRSIIDTVRSTLLWLCAEDDTQRGCNVSLAELSESDAPWLGEHGGMAGALLEEHGLLSCRGAVSACLAQSCRVEAEAALEAALALPLKAREAFLTLVREPEHRHDIRLPLSGALLRLLQELLAPEATVGAAVERAFGERASLCECSCIISEGPDAEAQQAHCDTSALHDAERANHARVEGRIESDGQRSGGGSGGSLLTAFVALHEVLDGRLGPTRMWPRTHTADFHRQLREGVAGPLALRARGGVSMTMRAGDVALMDSRLWHSGGANSSTQRRCLLVVSFGEGTNLPDGSTYSILPQLANKHTLRSLRDAKCS